MKQTPLVSDAVVYGDRWPYLVALVTLDGDAAARLAAGIGIPADPATMPHDDRVRAEIQAAVDAVNAHATTRSWTASTHNPMPWCRTGATRSV